MREELLKKLENNEYISISLYEKVKEDVKNTNLVNFNLDDYNQEILESQYEKYKNYFENMYKDIDETIHLDEDQIKAILADEDYSLVIAGAGTGKTTTIVSKVKYLVDIKKVDPEKIVVMSFTKKATEELEKRIVIDLEIPARVTTFHSLGFMYIREIFKNRKCYVVDDYIQNEIFYQYFVERIFPYKQKMRELFDNFESLETEKQSLFGRHIRDNYDKFDTFDEYFKQYKYDKLKEVYNLEKEVNERIEKNLNRENPITIKGELVKSKGEGIIANFLYMNGISYEYEKVYEEYMPDHKVYKPDFTLELGGEKVYLEYFGLSTYHSNQMNRYEKIKKIKMDYHEKHHTKFIKLDYMPKEDLISHLKEELINMGFTLRPKTNEEIFMRMLDNNPLIQIFNFKKFLYNVIASLKLSSQRAKYLDIVENYINHLHNEEKNQAIQQFNFINDFYKFYQSKLYTSEKYGFDFSDMIYYANMYMDTIPFGSSLNFEYIIIDEYQDISRERYELTKNIVDKYHAKVMAVGDDWQSIYAFAGSKIEYIYNFKHYFKDAKIFQIHKTYRNSQELINCTGQFIMKNKFQIKKDLISDKNINHPIKFVMFEDDNEYEKLKELILKIHSEHKDHNILILARTNRMIEKCFDDPDLKDEIGTKISYIGYKDIDIDGMTIHKAKGLTSDEVIVIGLNQNFSADYYGIFWLIDLFRHKDYLENHPFAEERRVFYVALTRTKNYVYLLTNKNPEHRSRFLSELYKIMKDNEKNDM